METGELLSFVVFPIAVGALAASVNQTRCLLFWAIPISLVAALLSLSLLLPSTARSTDPRQEAVAGLVFFGVPTLAAFALARRAAFRKRRGVSFVAASLTCVVTLLACLITAVNLGVRITGL